MTNKMPGTAGLAELEAVLDTYGADRTRWPAPVRHSLSGLIAGNAQARQMLEDAEVFDHLLDQAPAASREELSSLTERIVAAAAAQPRLAVSRPPSVVMPAPRRVSRQQSWAAAALAASLALGILAGQSVSIDSSGVASTSGDTAGSGQVALFDESDDALLSEELL